MSTLCDPVNCSTPGLLVLSFTISLSLFKLMSIESVMLSNHLILCHPLPFLPSSFPSIRSYPLSQLFTKLLFGGQTIRDSASASAFQMHIQDWFSSGLTGLISLLSKEFSSTIIQKHQFFSAQPSLWSNLHLYMTTAKNHSFDYTNLCWQGDVSAL